jgi:hypothetical protein
MIYEQNESSDSSQASYASTQPISSKTGTPTGGATRPSTRPLTKESMLYNDFLNKIGPARPTSIRFKTIEEYEGEVRTLNYKIKTLWEENQQKERECVEAESLVQSVLAQNIRYLKGQIEFEKKFNDLKLEYDRLNTESKEQSAQIKKLQNELSETNRLAESRRAILSADKIPHNTAKKVRRMYEQRFLDVLRQSRVELEQIYDIRPGSSSQYLRITNTQSPSSAQGSNTVCSITNDELNTTEESLGSMSSSSASKQRDTPTCHNEIDISEHDVDKNKITIFNRKPQSFDLRNCYFTSTLNGMSVIDYKFEESVVIEPGKSLILWNDTSPSKQNRQASPGNYFICSKATSFVDESFLLCKTYGDLLNATGCIDNENVVMDSLRDENYNVIDFYP